MNPWERIKVFLEAEVALLTARLAGPLPRGTPRLKARPGPAVEADEASWREAHARYHRLSTWADWTTEYEAARGEYLRARFGTTNAKAIRAIDVASMRVTTDEDATAPQAEVTQTRLLA